MITFELDVEALRREHDTFLAHQEREVTAALEIAGRHAYDFVHRYPGFKRRTGKLQDTTRFRVIRSASGRTLVITNPQPYAPAIDTGARPHLILPRRRRFLRFQIDGRWVFARRVHHPGNRPRKTFYRATQSAGRVFQQELEKRLTELARRS